MFSDTSWMNTVLKANTTSPIRWLHFTGWDKGEVYTEFPVHILTSLHITLHRPLLQGPHGKSVPHFPLLIRGSILYGCDRRFVLESLAIATVSTAAPQRTPGIHCDPAGHAFASAVPGQRLGPHSVKAPSSSCGFPLHKSRRHSKWEYRQ